MIIIIKGLSGAGKSTTVRAVAALAGAPVLTERSPDGRVLSTTHAHPAGGRPLTVLGCYDRRGAGCDAIRRADGGVLRVLETARRAARDGSDVILEGNALSFDGTIAVALAGLAPTRVLLIAPDVAASLDALRTRRRLRAADLPIVHRRLEAEAGRLAVALRSLPAMACLTVVPRSAAVRTAATWLDLPSRTSEPAPSAHESAATIPPPGLRQSHPTPAAPPSPRRS